MLRQLASAEHIVVGLRIRDEQGDGITTELAQGLAMALSELQHLVVGGFIDTKRHPRALVKHSKILCQQSPKLVNKTARRRVPLSIPRSRGLTVPAIFFAWGNCIPRGIEAQCVTDEQ